MMFHDCAECGGACCKGFGIPIEYGFDMYIIGVPLGLYRNDLEPDPRRYFELHEGVTITPDGKRFIVSQDVPVQQMDTPTGRYIDVWSRCTMLTSEGKCTIYDTRPDMCRNFTEETAADYNVPKGCKYEKEKP